MNSHSPAPSSERGRTTRRLAARSGSLPSMSERQIEAYLLARDAVRRIQRTSSLVAAMAQAAALHASPAQAHRQQNH